MKYLKSSIPDPSKTHTKNGWSWSHDLWPGIPGLWSRSQDCDPWSHIPGYDPDRVLALKSRGPEFKSLWKLTGFESSQPVWIPPVGILNLNQHHHSAYSVGMFWIILFHTFRSDIAFALLPLRCLCYLNYCCLSKLPGRAYLFIYFGIFSQPFWGGAN